MSAESVSSSEHTLPAPDAGAHYVPRRPEQTLLHRTIREQLEGFLARSAERGNPVPRLVSQSLTLSYKRVLYVLDPTDAARAARGQRVGIEEREDGSLSFWHGEHALLATAFPKDHGVPQGEIVANKRLSAALDFIKAQQRERAEAKLARPSTTRRDARLLRAGTPRRPEAGPSVGTPP